MGASSVERPDSRSFVSIHTRPTVPRDPPPELYRDVGDALQTLVILKMTRMGKGLSRELRSSRSIFISQAHLLEGRVGGTSAGTCGVSRARVGRR